MSSSPPALLLRFDLPELRSERFTLRVPPSLTVAALKRLVQASFGYPARWQRLFYRGLPMNAERTLVLCGCRDGSLLELRLRAQGRTPVFAVTLSGKRSLVDLPRGATFADVAAALGSPPSLMLHRAQPMQPSDVVAAQMKPFSVLQVFS